MPAPELASLSDRALLEETVRGAGAIARKFFGGHYKQWDKGKGQPVTEADLAVNDFLRDRLRSARPDYGWLSEETEDDPARLSAQFVFVVDPIDGTIGFLKGRPHFTICVAVVRDGAPDVAAVFNPITEEFFAAVSDGGATLNGASIHVSDRAQIEGCRMLGPKDMFSHPAWATGPLGVWPSMQVETRASIAYRMALVASGAFDATMTLAPKHDWDLAAGDLIVREAGGVVTSHDGNVLRYNGSDPIQRSLICAGPALHALLLARVKHLKLPR